MAERCSAGNSGSPSNEAHLRRASISSVKSTQAHPRRASISSQPIRRNSSVTSDSVNSIKNTIPNYLRASTGSCHDFCKYGRKQEFPEKPWKKKPLSRGITKSSSTDECFIDIFVSNEQKKGKIIKQNSSSDMSPSFDTKSHLPKSKPSGNNVPLPKKSATQDPPEIIKREVRSSDNLSEKDSLADNKPPKIERTVAHHPEKCSAPVKSKPLKTAIPSSYAGNSNIKDFKTSRKISAPVVPLKKVRAPCAPILSSKDTPSKTTSSKAKRDRNAMKKQNAISSAEIKSPENDNVSVKTLYVIESGTDNKSSMLSSAEEEFVSDNKSVENGNIQPLSANVQPVKEKRNIPRKSKVIVHEEKPRAPVKLKFRSGKVLDLHSDSNTPRKLRFRKPKTLQPEESKNDMQKLVKRAEGECDISLENKTLSPEKTTTKVLSNEKHRSPVKLKFRTGMMVDPRSDDNTPRRLRFRKPRTLGAEDEKWGPMRKNFRGVEENDDKTSTGISAGKVALKHQEGSKKDAQGLFNNVIEETASKLVESRKSKVKALVGAFETVISLQESKPSSHN